LASKEICGHKETSDCSYYIQNTKCQTMSCPYFY
jgi:hypothetical protein